ncbi:unnamed protein product [Closterium sp. Yama58-4]|nr:unnamed protein product [Closterium sp. Yama58-4]
MRACSSGAAAATLASSARAVASPASFETSRTPSAAASSASAVAASCAGPAGAAACREAVTAVLADMGGEGGTGRTEGTGGEGGMGGMGDEADVREGGVEEEEGRKQRGGSFEAEVAGEGSEGGGRETDGHGDVEGDCDDVDVFRTFRAEALAASRAHARLAAQAARAYDRGDHAAARKLSHASREEKERAERLHTEAAGKILAHRNRGRSLWELDLHGLLPGEAVSALEERLKQLEGQVGVSLQESVAAREAFGEEQVWRSSGAAREMSAEERVWGSSGVVLPAKVLSSARPELMVITGVGKHSSGGQPNLPMVVKKFLHEARYSYRDARAGVVGVRPRLVKLK